MFEQIKDLDIGELHIFSQMKNGFSFLEIPKMCQNTVFDYKYAYIPETGFSADAKVYVFENSHFLETNNTYFSENSNSEPLILRDENLLQI